MSKAIFSLRLPASIKKAAERLAKEDGVSLNQMDRLCSRTKSGSRGNRRRLLQEASGERYRSRPDKIPAQSTESRARARRYHESIPVKTYAVRRWSDLDSDLEHEVSCRALSLSSSSRFIHSGHFWTSSRASLNSCLSTSGFVIVKLLLFYLKLFLFDSPCQPAHCRNFIRQVGAR